MMRSDVSGSNVVSDGPSRAWRLGANVSSVADGRLTILTYNVLADSYFGECFPYCPQKFRDWGYRFKRILRDIAALSPRPSVLALQEVELPAFDELASALSHLGYDGGAYHRKSDSPVGVALFLLASELVVESKHCWSVGGLARDAEIGGLLRGTPPALPSIPSASSRRASPSSPSSVVDPEESVVAAHEAADETEWGCVTVHRRAKAKQQGAVASLVRTPSAIPGSSWNRQQVHAHNRLWSWLDVMPQVAVALVVRPRRQIVANCDAAGELTSLFSATTIVDSVTGASVFEHRNMSGRALPVGSPPALIIAVTHLYWNPKYPEVKVMQAALFSRAIDRLRRTTNAATDRHDTGAIFVGDFNVMPTVTEPSEFETMPRGGTPFTTGVYELLTAGRLLAAHPHHPASRLGLHPESVPELHSPLKWASAYASVHAEPPWSNWHTHSFKATLDYIFVATDECWSEASTTDSAAATTPDAQRDSSRRNPTTSAWRPLPVPLRAIATLDVPIDEAVLGLEGGAEGGCPNSEMPSDHIHLVAVLSLGTQ